MKHIVITYSNGDRESSILNGQNADEMIQGVISSSFKVAWFSKNNDGQFTNVTNMTQVRSIEILDEEMNDCLED